MAKKYGANPVSLNKEDFMQQYVLQRPDWVNNYTFGRLLEEAEEVFHAIRHRRTEDDPKAGKRDGKRCHHLFSHNMMTDMYTCKKCGHETTGDMKCG